MIEGVAAVVSFALVITGIVIVSLMILAVGWLMAPAYLRLVRFWAGRARLRTERYTGTVVPEQYPRLGDSAGFGDVRRMLWAAPTRRDLAWLFLHAVGGFVTGLLAVVLPLAALDSLTSPFYWWALPADSPAGSPFSVTSWWLAAAMLLVGVAYVVLTWWLNPIMARGVAAVTTSLLAPGRETELSERVSALTASRAAALDAHSAELRRIERDLHDGAQNKLVGVVMMLGLAERSLRVDPQQALPQLLRAQDAASDALSELRTLVHDIYPPILDELGLDGAVAALAGRCSVTCVLDARRLHRAPAAVEAAAYFVVAEALTNVVKHSGAGTVHLTISTRSGVAGNVLVIEVADDGSGGADETVGSGLRGIRRRVAAFEGTVTLDSPPGGPTKLEVELPCGF